VAVQSVDPTAVAAGAELQVGDVVVRVGGEPVSDAFHLAFCLRQEPLGPRTLVVQRKERRQELTVPAEIDAAVQFQDILPGQPMPKPPGLLDMMQDMMQE
jgi:S1-C subfamily serine protease